MVQHTNCIPKDKILYVLTDEDMVGTYDDRHKEGAYDALSDPAKNELFRLVKKGLEFGLGEAWTDYMNASMDEALRYKQIP